MTIGDMIRERREQAGITRNALAVRAGIDPAYLMRLERGDVARPSFAEVGKIADALGTTMDCLRPERGEKISKKSGIDY